MERLDKTDCELLNLLQRDCRMTLTAMAKKVDLSVDSVRKRLLRLERDKAFLPKVQIRPRVLGFPEIVDVKVQLRAYDEKQVKRFIDHLVAHPRVAELFSLSGEWDFTIVLIAKDHEDLAKVTDGIRQRFPELISGWSESMTKIAYKFETYDLHKLMDGRGSANGTGKHR